MCLLAVTADIAVGVAGASPPSTGIGRPLAVSG
jgi:hypothetical protein